MFNIRIRLSYGVPQWDSILLKEVGGFSIKSYICFHVSFEGRCLHFLATSQIDEMILKVFSNSGKEQKAGCLILKELLFDMLRLLIAGISNVFNELTSASLSYAFQTLTEIAISDNLTNLQELDV